jgi:hypothetical protein
MTSRNLKAIPPFTLRRKHRDIFVVWFCHLKNVLLPFFLFASICVRGPFFGLHLTKPPYWADCEANISRSPGASSDQGQFVGS